MGVFSKNNQLSISDSETTIIAAGAKVEGIFNCQSRLHIDGEIVGEVNSRNIVTIGKKGKFSGKVMSSKLIINGLFEGDAICDSIELLKGGILRGKIISKDLMIEAKAIFEGESKIKLDKKDAVEQKNILNKGVKN
ncbi:MAG: polymer-forming cytoskeletal protein [Epsilonproteobacteria bacterium]|nr:polymer-forming cytoskeletal protein [Campylobacterota bacterium]